MIGLSSEILYDGKIEKTKQANQTKSNSTKIKRIVSEKKDFEMSVYRIAKNPADRTEIKDFDIAAFEQKPNYPKAWFDRPKNAAKKPPMRIPKTDADLPKLRNTVILGIKGANLSISVAKTYVWALMLKNKEELNGKWESFGRLIGNDKDKIAIDNLCDMGETADQLEILDGNNGTSADDGWILVFICSIYRLCKNDNPTYLRTQVNNILRKQNAPFDVTAAQIIVHYRSWVSDHSYLALMAVVDMFLVKFPKNKFSEARIGTIISRDRDCAGLNDLRYLKEITGKTFPEIASWIWTKSLADEFSRLLKDNEEIDEIHSYMPYFMDLGLSDKSPYTSTYNPNVHYWVHVVGCCLSLDRSRNARTVKNAIIRERLLISHGAVFGYALTVALPEDEAAAQRDDNVNPPKNSNGAEWLAWYKGQNQILPDSIRAKLKKIWGKFGNSRPQSIGAILHAYPIDLL